MKLTLTPDERQALAESSGPVRIEDEQSRRIYVLVEESTFDRLKRQEDLAAIREGIADVEAGRFAPADEVFERIRTELGLAR